MCMIHCLSLGSVHVRLRHSIIHQRLQIDMPWGQNLKHINRFMEYYNTGITPLLEVTITKSNHKIMCLYMKVILSYIQTKQEILYLKLRLQSPIRTIIIIIAI